MDREKDLACKKRWHDKNKERIKEYAKVYNKNYRENHKKEFKKNTPKIPVVYAYFDNEVCLYVGRGSMTRPVGHKYTSQWWDPNLLLITMTCKDEWEAMEYEGKWGGRYQPKYNKDGYRYTI